MLKALALEPLYLDIETTYTTWPDVTQELLAGIKPPGNYKKSESIAKWWATDGEQMRREVIGKTALTPTWGEVTAIGLATETSDIVVLERRDGNEDSLLQSLLIEVECEDDSLPIVVGHNLIDFDLPFLMGRMAVHGLKVAPWLKMAHQMSRSMAYDTMKRWGAYRDGVKLDTLANALGCVLSAPVGEGSQMPQLWQDGDYETIKAHCEADIAKLREVHRKMRSAGL